jgi:hypothetical protein
VDDGSEPMSTNSEFPGAQEQPDDQPSRPTSKLATAGAQQEPDDQPSTSKPATESLSYDISNFVHHKYIPNETKENIILSRQPNKAYQFPPKIYKDSKRKGGTYKRFCKLEWLEKFPFLAYSQHKDGLYCLACVLFPCEGQAGRAKLLIETPFRNWKDVLTDITKHRDTDYHSKSEGLLVAFTNVLNKTQPTIPEKLDPQSQKQIAENRTFLASIIKCILFCGRQGIPLRGHRDDGKEEITEKNQGNFKALLNFRINSGDDVLGSHMEKCNKNASYISKTSQNELLDCVKEFIQREIIQDVKQFSFYGIEADEVTDIANWEQLGLVLRYLKDDKAQERLIEFIGCDKITGKAICDKILELLIKLGLDPNDCRAQTYDGAGNMAGNLNGCAARFMEYAPRAPYYHCASHELNLALCKACKVPEISCMIADMQKAGIFLKYSPKRQRHFEKSIEAAKESNENISTKKKKLKLLCVTRWVERHTTMEDFDHLYQPFVDFLSITGSNEEQIWDSKTITEANGILTNITSSKFIAAFQTNLYFSGFLKSLSVLLQGSSLDLVTAYEEIDTIKAEFKSIRENAETEFKAVFQEMVRMRASVTDEAINIPRRCGRQTLRSNVEADTPEDYWRRTVFVPFIDHLLQELDNRFSQINSSAIPGLLLLPCNLEKLNDKKMQKIYESFETDLPSPRTFHQEVRLWKRYWNANMTNAPKDMPSTLAFISEANLEKQYPNIVQIIRLLLVIPVTSSGVERANSILGRVKTESRSTMGQDRMNALILLYMHKDITIDIEQVIDIFAKRHPRKMLFINPLSE